MLQNAVFWDVAPCRSCVNRRFGGPYRLHLQGRKIRVQGTSVSRWLQKMETTRTSETSVHTRSTRRHIPEDGILHSHRRENLKFYILIRLFSSSSFIISLHLFGSLSSPLHPDQIFFPSSLLSNGYWGLLHHV
jgi:hypothetical protein